MPNIRDESGNPPNLGPTLAEVTTALVRLHRDRYGKGPTRSKSYLVDDLLVCVMRDVFSPLETTLIEAGESERVRGARLAVRDASQELWSEAVERVVGRRVVGHSGQVLTDLGMAVEVFVLAPEEVSSEA